MKIRSIGYTLRVGVLLGLFLSLSQAAIAASTFASGEYVPGEVLVKFKPTVSALAGIATVSAMGGSVQAQLNGNVVQVKLEAGKTVAETLASYSNDSSVEYAQPNYIYHVSAVPNSTKYAQQWAFKNTGQTILNTYTQPTGTAVTATHNGLGAGAVSGSDMNIEPAWSVTNNGDCSSIVVAVVDSGVNYNNPDLTANMWAGNTKHGTNFSGEGDATDPMDYAGHGTHVAGIIGADGNKTVAGVVTGVCWKANIMAVRVMDSTGSGTTAHIIQGINYAVTNGAKVINMSLGGSTFDQAFYDAITSAQTSDIVVVVAAGNANSDNETTATYPCNYSQPNLICVAALDQAYALASYSNYGASSVDVGAPGTNILSTWAGTATTISDTLSSGWTFTGGGAGGAGWAYRTANILFDQNYTANANHRAYKNFNLSGFDAAVWNFSLAGVVNSGDALNINMKSSGGDPFSGGTKLDGGSYSSPSQFFSNSYAINACNTSGCTLGFNLVSAAGSTGASGPLVGYFTIDTLTLNTTSYNTINGTSMASPMVAGLATMLRAYNPSYTYADVVNSIKNAGTATASLAGKTVTGKAVNVMPSLAYINTPTGLAAVVN
jgi:thermitase